MLKFILAASILCLGFSSQSQEENKFISLLDDVILETKSISYYSSSVNWDSLTDEMHRLTPNPKDISDLKPAFTLMINKLRDHHGRIMSTSDYSNLAHFTDHENSRYIDERDFPSEQWSIVNNLEARFEYALLPRNIGYLKIVGIGGNVIGQTEAERIRAAVYELAEKNVKEWIIDLRYNSGGNVNVMLAGIAPLLDARLVASVRNEQNEVQVTAEIKDGNFWYAGMNNFEIQDSRAIENPKIAVLLSKWTASSGELAAIAFKGQDNVKFFGEATGGYTTNNCFTVFDNQIALVISTGVFCDRDGNSYNENVQPDIEIEFDFEEDFTKDNGIIQASKWLME